MNAHVQLAELSDNRAPVAPQSIADTGIDSGFLMDLMVKTIYRMGLERPSEIGREMKLPVRIVAKLIEMAQSMKLLETRGQLGASMTAEMRYALTGKGREWTLEALSQSEYFGPTPGTLKDFSRQLEKQSMKTETLQRQALDKVFSGLTLSSDLMEKLGPAANCGASVLLYGPSRSSASSTRRSIYRSRTQRIRAATWCCAARAVTISVMWPASARR
jgi:hypothetical protein